MRKGQWGEGEEEDDANDGEEEEEEEEEEKEEDDDEYGGFWSEDLEEVRCSSNGKLDVQ